MKKARGAKERGFSLVELLVALTVMLVIVASVGVVFRGASSAWVRGEQIAFKYKQARAVMDRMSDEISQALVSPGRQFYFVGNQRDGDRFKGGSEADELFMIAPLSGTGGSELCEVGYWLKDKIFYRHFQLNPDTDYTTAGSDDELAEQVTDLVFRYYDGDHWVGFWQGGTNGIHEGELPRAVEIQVVIEDRRGKRSQVFKAIVNLATSG